jgi:hypothetical protein
MAEAPCLPPRAGLRVSRPDSMLHEFPTTHRDEIIARTRAKVVARRAPRATDTKSIPFRGKYQDAFVATIEGASDIPAGNAPPQLIGDLRVSSASSTHIPGLNPSLIIRRPGLYPALPRPSAILGVTTLPGPTRRPCTSDARTDVGWRAARPERARLAAIQHAIE